MKRYSVHLDEEGAEWLADEAYRAFVFTRDHGWREIAEDLRSQLLSKVEQEHDEICSCGEFPCEASNGGG